MKNLEDTVLDQFTFRHVRAINRLRCPTDVWLASRLRGANCGPASYAAAFECNVLDVIARFPQFPQRPHTTAAQMIAAFEADGVSVQQLEGKFPDDGVALIQFIGPWGNESTISTAALKRTHWIGVKGELIYDLNWGAWLPVLSWEAVVYPMFIDFEPRIVGWSVRCGLQITSSVTNRNRTRARTDRWEEEL